MHRVCSGGSFLPLLPPTGFYRFTIFNNTGHSTQRWPLQRPGRRRHPTGSHLHHDWPASAPTGYLPYPYMHRHSTIEAPYSGYRIPPQGVLWMAWGTAIGSRSYAYEGLGRPWWGRLQHSLVLGAARRILTGFHFWCGGVQAQLELLREGLELKSSEIHTHTMRGHSASPETPTYTRARAHALVLACRAP